MAATSFSFSCRSSITRLNPTPLLLFLPLLGNGDQKKQKNLIPTIRRRLLDTNVITSKQDNTGESSSPSSSSSFVGSLFQPAAPPPLLVNPHPSLSNHDLIPTTLEQRTLTATGLLSLWVGLVIGVPSYYLAGSLVDLGMAWWQGILTVMAGNFLLLFPLVWTGHAGVKYGIPFPVMARASFGIHGAHIPTLLRGLVACGWFGIETWIGGQGIYTLLSSLVGSGSVLDSILFMGTPLLEWLCFFSFWLVQVGIIWNGIDGISKFEKYCAPILLVMSLALLVWAYVRAGGFGAMLAASSQFGQGAAKEGQFWQVFFPALTANIGFWATLSLNITGETNFLSP